MKRYLVIGDFHIPRRAREVPLPLAGVMHEGGFDAVLCTGDLIGEGVLDHLRALAPEVLAVAGNMDHIDLPPDETLHAEGWRIGLVHGAWMVPRGDPEQLGRIAGNLDVDLLINGHTHADAVYSRRVSGKEVLFVNPGSATGIPGGRGGSLKPSLAVLELEPEEARIIVYRLEGKRLAESLTVFRKPDFRTFARAAN